MNANTSKGYVFFELNEVYEKERERHLFDDLLGPSGPLPSYATKGWYPVTYLIARGQFVAIVAERERSTLEVTLYIGTNGPRNKGSYEIKGGAFTESGRFVSVNRKLKDDDSFQAKDNPSYINFFICYSECDAHGGSLYLRWRVALGDIPAPSDEEQE